MVSAPIDDAAVGRRADPLELLDPPDVDERRRTGETQLEQRQEALAAGQDLGVGRAGEEAERLIEGRRPVVGECGRDHALAPFASCIARQTLGAVSGMSMWRIP